MPDDNYGHHFFTKEQKNDVKLKKQRSFYEEYRAWSIIAEKSPCCILLCFNS